MKDANASTGQPGLDSDVRRALDRRLALPPAQEDALIARVQARVMGVLGSRAQRPYHTVRASDSDGWQTIAPGVERKLLWSTPGEESCMMRLARGASVEAHAHLLDEECLVLEGTLRIGTSLVLKAGDFHVGRRGSAHELSTTDTGALVFLRGAREPA